MRVCFLDFDGVLNCQSWIASAKDRFTDPWPGGQPPSHEDPQYRDKLDTWLDAVRSANSGQVRLGAYFDSVGIHHFHFV